MKICVALDMQTKQENLNLVKKLQGEDIWLKVGLRSYIRDGKSFLEDIKKIDANFKIFLDLKFHDIPNTLADVSEVVSEFEIDMFNAHASNGSYALKTMMQRISKFKKRPLVLAVSALTSFDEKSFFEIYNQGINDKVKSFAIDSFEAGLDGMVCSVYESKMIKNATNMNFLTLTPGIRPFDKTDDDQKRVANIKTAKDNLSDFIVIGRPIYQSNEPKEALKKIFLEINEKNL